MKVRGLRGSPPRSGRAKPASASSLELPFERRLHRGIVVRCTLGRNRLHQMFSWADHRLFSCPSPRRSPVSRRTSRSNGSLRHCRPAALGGRHPLSDRAASAAGYGVAAGRAPDRCPICAGTTWRESSGQGTAHRRRSGKLAGDTEGRVVEDDEVIAQGMAASQAAGLRPVSVAKGSSGLARLRYEQPDVCVLDLMLPGTATAGA